jgi:glycosyltransferase involved in cell wall biosynthesis
MDVAGGAAALLSRRPWVYSERTVWHDEGVRQSLRGWMVARASAIVANSENAAMQWRCRLGARARVEVIPNALPFDEIATASPCPRAQLEVADDAELILFVGRLVPAKVGVLAPALAQLLGARPRAVALICGDGERRPVIAAELAELGAKGRVRLLGYRSDIWSLLRAADVFWSTSEYEGLPNSVCEAMAAGCPVVLSDIAAHRELAGPSALYFAADAPTAAAAAVARALDDRPAAQARAAQARARLEDRSILEVARAYVRLYQQLVRRDA